MIFPANTTVVRLTLDEGAESMIKVFVAWNNCQERPSRWGGFFLGVLVLDASLPQ